MGQAVENSGVLWNCADTMGHAVYDSGVLCKLYSRLLLSCVSLSCVPIVHSTVTELSIRQAQLC